MYPQRMISWLCNSPLFCSVSATSCSSCWYLPGPQLYCSGLRSRLTALISIMSRCWYVFSYKALINPLGTSCPKQNGVYKKREPNMSPFLKGRCMLDRWKSTWLQKRALSAQCVIKQYLKNISLTKICQWAHASYAFTYCKVQSAQLTLKINPLSSVCVQMTRLYTLEMRAIDTQKSDFACIWYANHSHWDLRASFACIWHTTFHACTTYFCPVGSW